MVLPVSRISIRATIRTWLFMRQTKTGLTILSWERESLTAQNAYNPGLEMGKDDHL